MRAPFQSGCYIAQQASHHISLSAGIVNSHRPNEPPLPPPLAYFLTWRTYGSWLPGDDRGWVQKSRGDQLPDKTRQKAATQSMKGKEVLLNQEQREVVEQAIRDHCRFRDWTLHAVNCRSNHVHVVVAADVQPKEVLRQLKYWATRRLNDMGAPREAWWAELGSGRFLNDAVALEGAIVYTLEAQDRK